MFKIQLTCFDFGKPEPYIEDIKGRFSTRVDELNTLNGPDTYGVFSEHRFLADVQKKTIAEDFTQWLRKTIARGYTSCEGDISKLIPRINQSRREAYGLKFFNGTPEYRYVTALDGLPISRRDLVAWLAQLADQLIPCIIEVDILRKGEGGLSVTKIKPNLKSDPLCNITFQFANTEFILTKAGTRRRLPKAAEEIRQDDMKRWLEKEKKRAQAFSSSPSKNTKK